MAHPCCVCGSECYCNGSIDDVVVDLTPKNCTGCEMCENDWHDSDEYDDEWPEDKEITDCPNCRRTYDDADQDFLICHHCWYDAERKIFTK